MSRMNQVPLILEYVETRDDNNVSVSCEYVSKGRQEIFRLRRHVTEFPEYYSFLELDNINELIDIRNAISELIDLINSENSR